MGLLPPPALPAILDLLTGNDQLFTSSIGNWTATGGTLTRDTAANYHVNTMAASLKWVTGALNQHIDVPVAGSFLAGKRYDALVWFKTEETTLNEQFTLVLGLQGTDTATSATIAISNNRGYSGASGFFLPIWVTWIPTANRTGITLRLNHSAFTNSTTVHLGIARVAAIANNGDIGLALTSIPTFSGAPLVLASNDYTFGPAGTGDTGPFHGFLSGLAYLGDSHTVAEWQGDNAGTIYEYANNPSASDLSGVGYQLEVGPNFVGYYVTEKDANTIQMYPDVSGGYDFEIHDRGTRHFKTVSADGTKNVNLQELVKLTQDKTSGSLSTVSPSSGTAFQVDANHQRFLVVPVTYNPTAGAAATCKVEVSPDNATYSTVITTSIPLGVTFDGTVNGVSLLVSAGWYVKLTVTNATLGIGTYW